MSRPAIRLPQQCMKISEGPSLVYLRYVQRWVSSCNSVTSIGGTTKWKKVLTEKAPLRFEVLFLHVP
jgi:hypothetical protein